MITADQLNQRVGQPIDSICPNGYANSDDNHCAHYVSHVLCFDFGTTCLSMVNGKGPGANIRVQQLFEKCPQVGRWEDRPDTVHQCLVFVTDASNVHLSQKKIDNVPKKHVGIYFAGKIWNYSNSHGEVRCVTPHQFQLTYPGNNIALFYGTMPMG